MYLSDQEIDNMSILMADLNLNLSAREVSKAIRSTNCLDLAHQVARPSAVKVVVYSSITAKHLATLPEYLDLATERGTTRSPMARMSLDELRRAMSAFIEVPNGEQKTYERAVLRAMGPKSGMFVLFPNLAQEIQDKIFSATVPMRPIRVDLIQTPNDNTTRFRFYGERRPIICATSKIACASVHPSIYKPLLPVAGRNILINPRRDILVLRTNAKPRDDLFLPCVSVALAGNSPLFGIQRLVMVVETFFECFDWAKLHFNVLKDLKLLVLQDHVVVSDPCLAAVHCLQFTRDGSEYLPSLNSGTMTFFGEDALFEFGKNVPSLLGPSAAKVRDYLAKAVAAGPVPDLVTLELFFVFRV